MTYMHWQAMKMPGEILNVYGYVKDASLESCLLFSST